MQENDKTQFGSSWDAPSFDGSAQRFWGKYFKILLIILTHFVS